MRFSSAKHNVPHFRIAHPVAHLIKVHKFAIESESDYPNAGLCQPFSKKPSA